MSGLFTLLTVVTLSSGPLILNTFIEWARDNRILGGDNSYCALQWPLAKLQHKFQSKLMVAQDDRLKATSEALVNMKRFNNLFKSQSDVCIPDVIVVVIQAKDAFARIVIFLEAPELENTNIRQKRNMGTKSHSIFIKSASFSWEESVKAHA
ncbi:hypothetical protein ACSBR1_026569 [Camellia fascicularis]